MLFFVSHWYTSPSPRRRSGRRGRLVSGGRARFAGASALIALLVLIQPRVLRCSRDCVGALSWMLDVRGDGACLVQNQLPTVRAALRPHYTNISLALRLQLRLLAARKQTSDTTPPLSSVLMTLARLYESSKVPRRSPPVATAGGPRRRAARQLPDGRPPATRRLQRRKRTTKLRGAAPRRRPRAPPFHTERRALEASRK